MKLVTYEVDHKDHIGVLSQDGTWVFPVKSFGMDYKDMLEVVRDMSESEKQLLEHGAGMEPYSVEGAAMRQEVRLKAPIQVPEQDIICLGLNYAEHAEESARFKKENFSQGNSRAVYFSKRVDRAVATGEEIPGHSDIVDSLDYEVELAVIIGKDTKNVTEEEARDCIFGYTVMNDVSARNVQTSHKQWYFGKSLDGFAPMGPCIVTADSIPYPPQLQISSWVNKELRQDDNTSRMLFSIDHIISELSQGMTLKAGTIISTGTPAGVGMGFQPPKFLKEGDVVECAIEEIGVIVNKIGR